MVTRSGDDGLGGGPGRPAHAYERAPLALPAFPGAVQVKVKGGRRRWKERRGRIYEWDSRHGAIETCDAVGGHLGEYDCMTGTRLKPANPVRRIEP